MSEPEIVGEFLQSAKDAAKKKIMAKAEKVEIKQPKWISMPCCERCWVDPPEKYRVLFEHGAPGLMPPPDDDFYPDDVLVVRQPVRFKGPEADDVKRCGFCGNPTWVGIFIRQDRNIVDFPPEVDN